VNSKKIARTPQKSKAKGRIWAMSDESRLKAILRVVFLSLNVTALAALAVSLYEVNRRTESNVARLDRQLGV
jgi:hypothetical protein